MCVSARPLLATLFETPLTCVVEAGKSGLDRNLGMYTILSYERDTTSAGPRAGTFTRREDCVCTTSAAQNYTAGKWRSWDLNFMPSPFAAAVVLLLSGLWAGHSTFHRLGFLI